jgi:hypothetical protein
MSHNELAAYTHDVPVLFHSRATTYSLVNVFLVIEWVGPWVVVFSGVETLHMDAFTNWVRH